MICTDCLNNYYDAYVYDTWEEVDLDELSYEVEQGKKNSIVFSSFNYSLSLL